MRFGLEYVGPIPSTENIDRQDDAINATSSRAWSRTRGQEVEEVTQGWMGVEGKLKMETGILFVSEREKRWS